jgi:hypothetical protein
VIIAGNKTSPPRTVFYSINAQWDNLGDVEIRATMLDWISDSGAPVLAYTGSMPEAYIAAFRAGPNVRWQANAKRYQAALWRAILTRRASIVFAPGPQVYSPSFKSLLKSFVNLVNVAGVRASGGSVLAVGRSLRGRGRVAGILERSIVSRFHQYVVRDTRSAEVIGIPLRNAPDLAFAHRSSPAELKRYGVISLRGDRPLDKNGLKAVSDWIRAHDLVPILLTQVKRDDDQHRALSVELGIEAMLWGDETHSEQLELVRQIYSEARLVVSNRLHALIFGLQFGVVPFAVLDEGSDKLTSTLRPWVLPFTTSPTFDALDRGPWDRVDLDVAATNIRDGLDEASGALSDAKAEFQARLRDPSTREVRTR